MAVMFMYTYNCVECLVKIRSIVYDIFYSHLLIESEYLVNIITFRTHWFLRILLHNKEYWYYKQI